MPGITRDDLLRSSAEANEALRLLANGLGEISRRAALGESGPIGPGAPGSSQAADREDASTRLDSTTLEPRGTNSFDAFANLSEQLRATTEGLRSFGSDLESASGQIGGVVSAIGRGATGILSGAGGGLGLGSLLSGGLGLFQLGRSIAGLFSGRSESENPQLTSLRLPPSLNLELGRDPATPPMITPGGTAGFAASSARPAPAQVVVNIQALDSRSFLDRSSELADAIKDAMLHSHSINDVVGDL